MNDELSEWIEAHRDNPALAEAITHILRLREEVKGWQHQARFNLELAAAHIRETADRMHEEADRMDGGEKPGLTEDTDG